MARLNIVKSFRGTTKHLNAAIQSLEKADEAARKFQNKADKLKEKAHA